MTLEIQHLHDSSPTLAGPSGLSGIGDFSTPVAVFRHPRLSDAGSRQRCQPALRRMQGQQNCASVRGKDCPCLRRLQSQVTALEQARVQRFLQVGQAVAGSGQRDAALPGGRREAAPVGTENDETNREEVKSPERCGSAQVGHFGSTAADVVANQPQRLRRRQVIPDLRPPPCGSPCCRELCRTEWARPGALAEFMSNLFSR